METNAKVASATVTGVAAESGQLDAGHLMETAIDEELFKFNSDDTPLMSLMLKARRVKVNSPEVDHYVIQGPEASFETTAELKGGNLTQGVLPMAAADQYLARRYTTLLVKGVAGYTPDGRSETPGRWLMLFVNGHDASTGNPIVRAVNGKRDDSDSEVCRIPDIPAGSTVVVLANSLYETQKEVDPDVLVPKPTRIYLQKRGMNQVVSDYFDSQRKRIPFSKAVLAEQAIANFKVRGNRTLWAGRGGKFKVDVPKMGLQHVYTTEGLRWQFKRVVSGLSHWDVETVIAIAKMFFTGEDVPKTAILLAGRGLLERIQNMDYSRHPEIKITTRVNSVGWTVTSFHTVFGDIDIKREPTLDRLGWSNSGALIGENRLVHYVYSTEHSFSDRVEGEEATRNGILIWDALALKGNCHLWIDGDDDAALDTGAEQVVFWGETYAPSEDNVRVGVTYVLTVDCEGISPLAKAGQRWQMRSNGGKTEWIRLQ